MPAPKPKKKPKTDDIHPLVNAQKAEAGRRPCVDCGNPFRSRCPGNRICGRCKRGRGDSRLPFVFKSELRDEPAD